MNSSTGCFINHRLLMMIKHSCNFFILIWGIFLFLFLLFSYFRVLISPYRNDEPFRLDGGNGCGDDGEWNESQTRHYVCSEENALHHKLLLWPCIYHPRSHWQCVLYDHLEEKSHELLHWSLPLCSSYERYRRPHFLLLHRLPPGLGSQR